MKGRGLAVAMVVALAVAPACNGGKPSRFKRSPAEAHLMSDTGAKKLAVKKGQEHVQLKVVPKKTGKKPDVKPLDPNPFAPRKEEKPGEEEEKKDPYAGEMGPMKRLDTKRSDYKPEEDKRSWYAVDEEGKRIYGRKGKKKQETEGK